MFEQIKYGNDHNQLTQRGVLKQFVISNNRNFKPYNKKNIVEPGELMFATKGAVNQVEIKVNDNVAYIRFFKSIKNLKKNTPVVFLFQDDDGAVFFLMDRGIYVI